MNEHETLLREFLEALECLHEIDDWQYEDRKVLKAAGIGLSPLNDTICLGGTGPTYDISQKIKEIKQKLWAL